MVDREDEVLAILRTALQSTDYVLLRAKTGEDALVRSRLKSHINLTIIDPELLPNEARNVVGHWQTGVAGMNTPSDPYANLQADLDRHMVEFMKNELALCFTFSTIAGRKYETENQESADKAMANAEKAYDTLIQYLSDPKHSKHVTVEQTQDITAELERLRERLDGLVQRFKK